MSVYAPEKPFAAARHIPASNWSDLVPGDLVWVHERDWGYDTGSVDEVSGGQKMMWIVLDKRGRRLLCAGDPVSVWTR